MSMSIRSALVPAVAMATVGAVALSPVMVAPGQSVLPAVPSIDVRTAVYLQTAVIRVTDSGPGIAPWLQADLFKEGTSTKKGEHSGLGLAIVHRLVARMGGTVAYESGQGATVFSLTFPV